MRNKKKSYQELEKENMKLKHELNRTDLLSKENEKLKIKLAEYENSLMVNFTKKIEKIVFNLTRNNPTYYDNYLKVLNKIQGKVLKTKFNADYEDKSKYNKFQIKRKILFSVIMPTYNSELKFLKIAIASLNNQNYKNWELCIIDDGSKRKEIIKYLLCLKSKKIKIKFLSKNTGISNASNEAAKMAKGDYIVIMDHDDMITADALYILACEINKKNCDLLYSNENQITEEGNLIENYRKVRFSKEYLLENNYICHLSCIKKSLFEKVGGFRIGYEGAQDHDLFLRIMEKTNKICFVPYILYHWRAVKSSTAFNIGAKPYALKAGVKAIKDYFKRNKIKAKVSLNKRLPGVYVTQREIINNPLVSIVIPFRDNFNYLEDCLKSIIKKSSYKNIEVICVNNNSKDKKGYDKIKRKYYKGNISFYDLPIKFNFSKINNLVVKKWCKGEHILFLNNDTKVISEDWIERMLEHSQFKDIGAVGCKLLFEDDTIQHAGIWMLPDPIAVNIGQPEFTGYDMNRVCITQNPDAVTGACLMVKKELFLKIGGFDENLAIAFNDVDLCLRLNKLGYRTVYTPHAKVYHYESKSRGYEYLDKRKAKRFEKEITLLRSKVKGLKYNEK